MIEDISQSANGRKEKRTTVRQDVITLAGLEGSGPTGDPGAKGERGESGTPNHESGFPGNEGLKGLQGPQGLDKSFIWVVIYLSNKWLKKDIFTSVDSQ